jgi:hypothetical protein
MRVAERIRTKAEKLLTEAPQLYMQAPKFEGLDSRREAWVASARQLVTLLAPNPLSPYRMQVDCKRRPEAVLTVRSRSWKAWR